MYDHEQSIRERAYQIWEVEGRPHGQEAAHWERARRELDGEGDAAAPDRNFRAAAQPAEVASERKSKGKHADKKADKKTKKAK